MRRGRAGVLAIAVALVLLTVGAERPAAQSPHHHHGHHGHHGHRAAPPSGGHDHGAREGWKFTLPKGDAANGRDVFVRLGCNACHEVKGQTFSGAPPAGDHGPELSEMAAHHEAEFFAEAIVNPNAVVDEPRWRAADGTSKMPSFNDVMTVQELVDLVTFLKSLAPPGATSGGHRH